MEEVLKFLKEAETYYLATVEGNQPRVRPFGTVSVFEGRLYIQTGKIKEVSKQLHANPKAELCAFKDGEWIRVTGQLIEDGKYLTEITNRVFGKGGFATDQMAVYPLENRTLVRPL